MSKDVAVKDTIADFIAEIHAGFEAGVNTGIQKTFETGALNTKLQFYNKCSDSLDELLMGLQAGDIRYAGAYLETVQQILARKPPAQIGFEDNKKLLTTLRREFHPLVHRVHQDLQDEGFAKAAKADYTFAEALSSVRATISALDYSPYMH